MEYIKEKWHNFKIWFCSAEVDFFQKEIERWKYIAENKKIDFDFLDKTDQRAIDQLSDKINVLLRERKDLLFLDPEKIVTTEVVTIDEIGRPVQKKVLLIGGRQLSPEETKILQEEARFIKRTMWWDVVQNTVVNTAKLKMFEGAKDYGDMVGGKGILYAADIYRKILDRILE